MPIQIKVVAVSVGLMLVSACSQQSAISEQAKTLALPNNWQSQAELALSNEQAIGDWQLILKDAALVKTINNALRANFDLKTKFQDLLIAEQEVIVANASDFPELTLATSQNRRKDVSTSVNYSTNASIDLQLSYEVDLWGKLSAEQQRARLNYQVAKLSFEQAKNTLITSVVNAWFNLSEANKLYDLYRERAANLENNLAIIDASYKLGLSEALDVYLTQNEVNREYARIEQQRQLVTERKRALELLLSQYPSGYSFSDVEISLPKISEQLYLQLPSNTLTSNYVIQQKWYQLLSADASLAIAHKQRFPSLTLTASGGDTSDELANLLDGGALAWSVAGSLTAPLFNAGRLASLEEQAKLLVTKREQEYLAQVYQALSDVENQISNHYSLIQQLSYYQKAETNALTAQTLSFNQYLKGLVSYSTVLEAQRRAFDAQTSVIQIANQLIQNRVQMYASIGGSNIAKPFEQQLIAYSQVENNNE